jgi:hypothetical protein
VTGAKARIPWAFADAEIGDRPERVPEAQLAVQSLTSIFQSPDLHAGWDETGSLCTQTGSHLPRGSSSGPSNDPRRTDCGAGGTRRRFVAGQALLEESEGDRDHFSIREISRRTGRSRNTGLSVAPDYIPVHLCTSKVVWRMASRRGLEPLTPGLGNQTARVEYSAQYKESVVIVGIPVTR